MERKKISIVTPCYNEEENVEPLTLKVREIFAALSQYDFEHIFIDNASTDKTVEKLKNLAAVDKRIKIICNARNFGHIRSPYYALLQAQGDAVITLAADLQEPPELIAEFLGKWEQGFKIIIGVKTKSRENQVIFAIRKFYYNLLKNISELEQIRNFHGFGLYDRSFIDVLKKLDEPYPYFRGLITEFGFNRVQIEYTQQERQKGRSKNNFYTLYDMAMLGFVNHSKVPLRLSSFIGFGASLISFAAGMVYLIYKLLFWSEFQLGLAPLAIGIFFFGSIQLFFIGIIGEYVGAIYTHVKKKPLVVEKERINFDDYGSN